MQSQGTRLFNAATACFFHPGLNKALTCLEPGSRELSIVLLIVFFVFIHQQVVSREFYPLLFSPHTHSQESLTDMPRAELKAHSCCHLQPRGLSAHCCSLSLYTNDDTHKPICCCKSGNITISSAWHSEQTKCLYCHSSSHTTCQFYELLK